ncbi:MAG TPA: protein kinase [Candidatus Limnocylindria bacterium]|nr:protein kinase [Candidatus Limnocylindria bacterium]
MKYCPICDQSYPDNLDVCDVDGATLRFKSGKQDSLIGKVIKGRYRVIQKLGEGGMGTVYLAEQVAVSRKVALKWLHSDYARDEEFVRRFRQEAKLAAALNHRNVVTIFDFDQADDDSLYIVMEHVDGTNLADVLREGPIEIRRALRMAVQIAEGLAAAHRAGVIHRDVKPENVMVVGREEDIKLMDFGISRLRDTGGASRLTRSGTIMGTPAYMAPEQIEGGEVSERTDIYAFGIVLYEMLSGAVPFQAKTPGAILVKHLQETAAPLRKIRREVPALVERVVAQALEKDALRRPSSMQEVVEALKDAQLRAEVTKTSATRSLVEPWARLGLSFGSAAARFKGIFGKGTSAISTKTEQQEAGQSRVTPAGAPEETTVLHSEKILPSEESVAVPRTALVTGIDLDDKPNPVLAARFQGVLEKDASAASPVTEPETGPARAALAAESDATLLQSQTFLQNDKATIAPQTILITQPDVEEISNPSPEFGDTTVLTKIEEKSSLEEVPVLEKVVEITPVAEPQDIAEVTPRVATTVIASTGETMTGKTVLTPTPKSEEAGGFRWKWLPVGGVAAALLAGLVYYQWRSQPQSEDVAVLEQKEPVAQAPIPEPVEIQEKKAPDFTLPAEKLPVKKTEPPVKTKAADVAKPAVEKRIVDYEPKPMAKKQEAVAPVEVKDRARVEPEIRVKEQPPEIASIKPIKPPEPLPASIAPEARLVSLAVLSDRKELDVNSRIRLTVRGKYSDGRENEIVGSVRWESSDGNVAVVNSRGELEARKEGKAQITATYSGLTSPGYTFFVKGVPQPEKAKSGDEGIQDLRRRLLR